MLQGAKLSEVSMGSTQSPCPICWRYGQEGSKIKLLALGHTAATHQHHHAHYGAMGFILAFAYGYGHKKT